DYVCVFFFSLGQAKTQEWVHTAQSTVNKACNKAADSNDEAQQEKEQSAELSSRSLIYNENFPFVEQTAEQVMNMTWGAIDGVKNTLGINETTHEKK
ncbi:hypothetical protein C3L33_22138, partial [Rhododendron williamsianum]